jgi:hypothetical protein
VPVYRKTSLSALLFLVRTNAGESLVALRAGCMLIGP